MSRRGAIAGGPLVLLGLAAACAAAAVAVWFAAFEISAAGTLDGRAVQSLSALGFPVHRSATHDVASLGGPWPLAVGALVLIVLAVGRGRWLMAATLPAILLVANLVTRQLKPLLADARVVDGAFLTYPSSWPSGHSTAAMSLALCLVLVAGPRLRPLAALLGAGYAIAVGCALVVLGSHLPSDVLGGYLVAAVFTLLGAAALMALEERWPAAGFSLQVVRRTSPPPTPVTVSVSVSPAVLAAGAATLLALAVVVVARRSATAIEVVQNPPALLAAIGITLLGLALTFGLARALRA